MKRWVRSSYKLAALSSALGCTAAGSGELPTYQEARSAVVYGEDDRREPFAYPVGSEISTWARSSAMLVGRASLRLEPGAGYLLAPTATLHEAMKLTGRPLCAEEPFAEEPVFPTACSAFLVAPDTVITAGHCVRREDMCPYLAFAFGVAYDLPSRDPSLLGPDDVYLCKEVLEQVTIRGGPDYGLVRLDRAVSGRSPLPLRRMGKIADDEELVLIGHPLGLPTKIAAGGGVLDNAPEGLFKASTDSYGGGSGSVDREEPAEAPSSTLGLRD